jgi:hypothetical protein
MIKLITLLATGIPAIIAGVISFIARKLGTATATIAAFVLLTAALVASINAIVTTLMALAVVPSWISYSLGLFVPADFGAVLSAIVSARICRVAYDLSMLKVKAINDAN